MLALQVTLGDRARGVSDPCNAGARISPARFHDAVTKGDPADTVLIDVRNGYESDVGFFSIVRFHILNSVHTYMLVM